MRLARVLDEMGIRPLGWADVLRSAGERLRAEDFRRFQRLHDSFVHYRSAENLRGFYGFVFRHSLQDLLPAYRRARLEQIGLGLMPYMRDSLRLLEVGAGTGIWADALGRLYSGLDYAAYDVCPEAREWLARRGHRVVEPGAADKGGFDLILCADSLGEINADDDDWLADPGHAGAPGFAEVIDERYGFAEKLAPWRGALAKDGVLLLFEPFRGRAVPEALAALLGRSGWACVLLEAGGSAFLELRAP